ncbi:MAG: beta-ketoacyl-[acyl-carrier-protein] synthase II [Planctomycetota bacterium]|nr:MAG: beta-ketoacyl-[acyl-carrier-protein] synthase II [Planctomycetota bacterium]
MSRVFITGIGLVTPVGCGRDTTWRGLLEGRSGIRRLTRVEVDDLPVQIGGEVLDLQLDAELLGEKVSPRKMDRSTQFVVAAALEALQDAGLPIRDLGERVGVIVGAGLSGLETLQHQTERLLARGPRSVSPFTIPLLMPNAGPANVSLVCGATGPVYTVSSACASSGHAMIDAFLAVQRGEVDVAIAGGTDACLTRLAIAAFANMKAMTREYNDRPEKGSRPFDAHRSGFVMSEGAGVAIFESQQSMQRRGATPYAEIVGYGSTADSFHLVQPDPQAIGVTRAIQQALDRAGLRAEDIAAETYVNAHGTSTPYNDAAETLALKKCFGAAAPQLKVSSTKSMTGHMIGAAAAVELAVCALALKHQVIPPTINYETPDPECDLDYVPNEARHCSIRFALNNSFGFGGHNVCLALRRVE